MLMAALTAGALVPLTPALRDALRGCSPQALCPWPPPAALRAAALPTSGRERRPRLQLQCEHHAIGKAAKRQFAALRPRHMVCGGGALSRAQSLRRTEGPLD